VFLFYYSDNYQSITIADFSGEQEKKRLRPSLIATSGTFRSTIRRRRRRRQQQEKTRRKKERKET
jgi:hypothetical protein